MTVLLDAIASHLQTHGVGTVGVDLFKSLMPDTPDLCVAVHEYPGQPPAIGMGGGHIQFEMPRFQVVARAGRNGYVAARAKLMLARASLAEVADLTISGLRFLSIVSVDMPMPHGLDSSDRPTLGCNFAAYMEPES